MSLDTQTIETTTGAADAEDRGRPAQDPAEPTQDLLLEEELLVEEVSIDGMCGVY